MSLPINPNSIAIQIFTTTGSEYLADGVAKLLPERFKLAGESFKSITRGTTRLTVFDNNNIEVAIEKNVRGELAVVVHTQVVPGFHDHLFELFALQDALEESRPAGIVVVFPYYPYARSDMKRRARTSVMGKRMAQMINGLGIDDVLIVQPHDEHVQHYFTPSANLVTLDSLLINYMKREILPSCSEGDCVIVFADSGAEKRFANFPRYLGLRQAYIAKERDGVDVTVKGVVGDVANKRCFIIDDEITSGGTLCRDAEALIAAGARETSALVAHGVLSKRGKTQREVAEDLQASALDSIVITNTTPCEQIVEGLDKFKVLNVLPLLAEALKRFITAGSLSEFWNPSKVEEFHG